MTLVALDASRDCASNELSFAAARARWREPWAGDDRDERKRRAEAM